MQQLCSAMRLEDDMGLSRMYSGCRKCPLRDTCKNKRMEGLMCYQEQNMAASISSPIVADMIEPMTVKHDYRDIKIAEGMTVTIDLEDVKRKLEEEFYRGVGLRFN